jgi:ankyrin repeat protein
VEYLVARGSNINSRNNDENTAIILASDKGHKETIEILLNNGAAIKTNNKDGNNL